MKSLIMEKSLKMNLSVSRLPVFTADEIKTVQGNMRNILKLQSL